MSDGILIANRWGNSGEGKVIFHPKSIALLSIQLNREFQRPAALGDLRTRQALLHAIDRQALIDKLFSGFSDMAHGWLSPRDPDFSHVEDAITRYDYDLARAQRLMEDAGWQKGSDGFLRNAAGERFELEYRAVGRDYQNAATIVADSWKRLGIDAKLVFVPEARTQDNEWMAKAPGVRAHYMVSAPVGGATTRYLCNRVPSPDNQWLTQETNPAGYCNQDMERYARAFDQAFPFGARLEPFKEMMRLALRDLPYLPLYFELQPVVVRASVTGINAVPPKDNGRIGMHSYTWDLP
jgi:peptide/nickel transport system substrate-binding protein